MVLSPSSTTFDLPLEKMEGDRPRLSPTSISQFVSHSECSRLFEFQASDTFEADHYKQYSYRNVYDQLSPVLAADGIAFEQAVESRLNVGSHSQYDHTELSAKAGPDWLASRETLSEIFHDYATADNPEGHLLITQAHLGPALGVWPVGGNADALLVWRSDSTGTNSPSSGAGSDESATDETSPHLRFYIVDAKASTEERTYHQTQVAVYTLLLRQFLSAIPWLAPSAIDTTESPQTSQSARFHDAAVDSEGVLPATPSGALSESDELTEAVTWDISGGVITRDSDLTVPAQLRLTSDDEPTASGPPVTPGALPTFDLRSRELDIQQLLSDTGRFNRLWNSSPGETQYSLTNKCHTCRYRTACFTSAVEDGDLGVLGISAAEQTTLEEHGIETVADLADLAHTPRDPDPRSDPKPDIKHGNNDTYNALMEDTALSQSLSQYITQAQSYLGRVQSSSLDTLNGIKPAEIPGSREAPLPEDNPPFDPNEYGDGLAFPEGGLVRVYLVPHSDPRFDRVTMVSAHVTATAAPNSTAESIAVRRPDFPTNESEAEEAEQAVIKQASKQLATAITSVSNCIDVDGIPLHFYTFTSGDADTVTEALERHRTVTPEAETLADLLQCRKGIDEHVLSPVQPAIDSQIALGTPSAGLLQYWELLSPDSIDDALPSYEMDHERQDGTQINLKQAFTYQFFSYEAPFASTGTAPTLYPEQNTSQSADGRLPLWPTATGQVPVEYLAAAAGHLSTDFIENLDDHYDETPPVQEFRYIDHTADDPVELTYEDTDALAKRLVEALNHVERSVTYKELADEKVPFDAGLFNSFSLGETDLQRASLEYLQLEHDTAQDELDQLLELPVHARIATGRAIPVVVADATVDDDQKLTVEGKLAYDHFFDDGDYVANACRHSGAKGDATGSWLVANELDNQGDPIGSTSPAALKRGVPITVDTLDVDNRDITFSALPGYLYQNETEFEYYHGDWTTEPSEADEDTTLFERNSVFILDPRPDDLTSQRIHDALDSTETGGFACDFINSMLTDAPATPGKPEPAPTTDRFPDHGTNAFSDWASEAREFEPNAAQTEFIEQNDSQLVALQGPPGTGKTSGALAPALLSRLFAAGVAGDSTIGLVVAESNKAIDEVMEDVAKTYQTYQQSPLYTAADDTSDASIPDGTATTSPGPGLTPVEFSTDLVRVTGSPPPESEKLPGVAYLSYYDDVKAETDLTMADVTDRLRDSQTAQHTLSEQGTGTAPVRNPDPADDVEGQTTLTGLFNTDSTDNPSAEGDGQATQQATNGEPLPPSATGTSNRPHTLIFTTPTRLYKLIDEISTDKGPSDWLDEQVGFFDLVAVDEASMTRLPSFLLSGAFARPTAQFLLAGDHRQMPPVRQHDWEEESRRTVMERAGHLSLLDFVRLLRGELPLDDVDHTDAADLPASLRDVDYDIPLVQLPTGYRSHTHVTEFLSENVYSRDNLAYNTEQTAVTSSPSPSTDGSAAALDPDIPLTLIVHDDTTSQQSNPTEAAICHTLDRDRDPSESFGIVTPHNAQRGLLTTAITDADVDTVERYQGDERDIIAVSATASAPQFLHHESDFILNPNRLNVAMSRMKHKLVIIASSTVFTLMPEDVTTYDQAYLWKSLFRGCGAANGTPAWSGDLSDFCSTATKQSTLDAPDDVSLEVHHYNP
ncbi:hypothetical protein DJ84_17645 [Halorubrum ezzemoulense]|nr:hypothetical protein DJ84_17645 [Halorubrum ezzemoulense]